MADQQPFAGMAQEATLAELTAALHNLASVIEFLSPDAAGRLRVAAETVANIATITTVTTVSTVTTVGTVTTIGTLTNQTQIGGLAANQQMIALTLGNEADLRRNIVIS
jgi:hypothetical protein